MSKNLPWCFGLVLIVFIPTVVGQYENERCKCICPSLRVVANQSIPSDENNEKAAFDRKVYIDLVPPLKCNCDGLVLPKLLNEVKSKEFCPLCECRFESRNTDIIRYVIIAVIGIIALLVTYMIFLLLLDPYIHRGKGKLERLHRMPYQEQINEDISLEEPCGRGSLSNLNLTGSSSSEPAVDFTPSRNVLGSVRHQQTKWKKQVSEQRKNIYDKHTMLN